MHVEPGDVHVWRFDLDGVAGTGHLSRDERERAERITVPRVRRRFENRRALMRDVLARYLACAPETIDYIVEPGGKPRLAGTDLSFSVTSRDDCALLAVTSGMDIGVDLERVRQLSDLDDLIRAYIPADEHDEFFTLSLAARERRFLQAWTAIEATLKLYGTGFARDAQAAIAAQRVCEKLPFAPSAFHVATLAYYDRVGDVVQFRYGDG